MEIRIGTSGWYYKHWRGPFYPAELPSKEMLHFYLRHFDTVELNNTFYRLPTEGAVEAWRAQVPDGFLFSVKGSRFITHMKKLKEAGEALDRFFERLELLGSKLGPIVFQLPPRWRRDPGRLEAFLEDLPPGKRYAFEFRDTSWHDGEIYGVLRRHDAAFCIFDLQGELSPETITADFAYVRLHGPSASAYEGRYDGAALRSWARRIERWKGELKAVYLYFDNDQGGHAAENARQLKELLGR